MPQMYRMRFGDFCPAPHLMPQMYKMRSSDFCICGWWKKATPGAVRGTSTATWQPAERGPTRRKVGRSSDHKVNK